MLKNIFATKKLKKRQKYQIYINSQNATKYNKQRIIQFF